MECERFVAAAAEALGGADILVNNVGGAAGGTLESSSDEDWAATFDLNLFHAVRATRAALPHFRKRGGGSVVIISSISGWKPAPTGAQYGCAKAAEMHLAGALAMELAPENVRVNTVCPGSILFPGGGWDRMQRREPQKFGEFEETGVPRGPARRRRGGRRRRGLPGVGTGELDQRGLGARRRSPGTAVDFLTLPIPFPSAESTEQPLSLASGVRGIPVSDLGQKGAPSMSPCVDPQWMPSYYEII